MTMTVADAIRTARDYFGRATAVGYCPETGQHFEARMRPSGKRVDYWETTAGRMEARGEGAIPRGVEWAPARS